MEEINTKEALAALPAGTVLREKNGDIGEWDGTVLAGTDGGWWGLDYVPAVFPLTVLYRPDQPDLAAVQQQLDQVRELADENADVGIVRVKDLYTVLDAPARPVSRPQTSSSPMRGGSSA